MEQIIIRKLDRAKQYLKTGFKTHCVESEILSADHCIQFALSDRHSVICESCEAYLCSDEANCYHNNYLIAVAREIGKRVGVAIVGYDCSEPQQGKDICGRTICL